MKTINDSISINVLTRSSRNFKGWGSVFITKKSGRTREKQPEISVLANSFFWSLSLVFILHINQGFRLIAIYKKSVLCDALYPSEMEAREAFLVLFKNRVWLPVIEPSWTHSYPPDADWLEQQFKILAKYRVVIGRWYQVSPSSPLPAGFKGTPRVSRMSTKSSER